MNDLRKMQWGDICKSHFMLTGKVPHFREIREQLQKQIDAGLIVQNKEIEGEYQFTDKGWAIFQRKT